MRPTEAAEEMVSSECTDWRSHTQHSGETAFIELSCVTLHNDLCLPCNFFKFQITVTVTCGFQAMNISYTESDD